MAGTLRHRIAPMDKSNIATFSGSAAAFFSSVSGSLSFDQWATIIALLIGFCGLVVNIVDKVIRSRVRK